MVMYAYTWYVESPVRSHLPVADSDLELKRGGGGGGGGSGVRQMQTADLQTHA